MSFNVRGGGESDIELEKCSKMPDNRFAVETMTCKETQTLDRFNMENRVMETHLYVNKVRKS